MITPRFKFAQDKDTLTITIQAPYCSLRDLDISLIDNEFIFLCKPYYLRLNLPGSVKEDVKDSSFDSDLGEFNFCYEKQQLGELFKDLDLIIKFLPKKVEADYNNGTKKIMILTNEGQTEKKPKPFNVQNGFGFALQGNKNFTAISTEFDEVFEVDPCDVTLKERHKLRLQYEQGKFNIDHYIADFIDDEEICEISAQKSPWKDQDKNSIHFDAEELDYLKNLYNVEYSLSEEQINYCHNSLIDILFAFCYDRRSTFYEDNIESGWTIVKLAASFCWLDAFEHPKEALICGFRRSLIYPLYRNFNLSHKVHEDLKDLISLGDVSIIKCLIKMYYIFLTGDCSRYILNNLFIKDYIIYIMNWDQTKWNKVVEEVMKIEIKKDDLGLNLDEIEQGYNLHEGISHLQLSDTDSDDDTSEDSGSSDESSDTESSESEKETSN